MRSGYSLNMNLEKCSHTLNLHLAAENSHDLEKITSTYGENPYVNLNGRIIEGIERIEKFHKNFGFGEDGSFSELSVDEKNRRITEDAIIIEQVLSGTHSAKWQGFEATGQGFEATGKSFKINVCTIYLFDQSSLLKGENVYFDSFQILSQLGLY